MQSLGTCMHSCNTQSPVLAGEEHEGEYFVTAPTSHQPSSDGGPEDAAHQGEASERDRPRTPIFHLQTNLFSRPPASELEGSQATPLGSSRSVLDSVLVLHAIAATL